MAEMISFQGSEPDGAVGQSPNISQYLRTGDITEVLRVFLNTIFPGMELEKSRRIPWETSDPRSVLDLKACGSTVYRLLRPSSLTASLRTDTGR